MKNCKSCGAQMEDNQRFCLNCGAENQPIQSNVNQYNPSLQPQNVNNGNPSFNSNTSDGVNGYQNTIPQSPVPPKKKNLSAGAIAAIVIAAVLVVALVVSIPAIVIRSKAKTRLESGDSSYSQTESNELSFGNIDGNTYSNDFANLHFDLPSEEWAFLSDEDVITYLPTYSIDPKTGKPFISSANDICYADIVIYNQSTNENIIVQFTPYNNTFLSEDIVLKSILDQVEEEYLNQGITVSNKDTNAGSVEINGNNYSIATIQASAYGNEISQIIAVAKIGDNYVSITVTGKDKANTDKLFNMFY